MNQDSSEKSQRIPAKPHYVDPWTDTSNNFEYTEVSADTSVVAKWAASSTNERFIIEQTLKIREGISGSSTLKRQMFNVEDKLLFGNRVRFMSFNEAQIESRSFVSTDWQALISSTRAICTKGEFGQRLETLIWTDFEPDYLVIQETILSYDMDRSSLALDVVEGSESNLIQKRFSLEEIYFPKLFKVLGVASFLEIVRLMPVPEDDTWEKVRMFFLLNGDDVEEKEKEQGWECANALIYEQERLGTLIPGNLQEVVGESFNQNNFEAFRNQFGCEYGQEFECLVDLVAEPNNRFSKTGCAVAVKIDGLLLGYIPEAVNAAYYELAQSKYGTVHAKAKIWFAPPEPDSAPKNSVLIYSKYPPALPSP